jgi:hypothetical protein
LVAAAQVQFEIDPVTGAIAWGTGVADVLGSQAAQLTSLKMLTDYAKGAARTRLRLMFDALRGGTVEAEATTIVWSCDEGARQVEFAARARADGDGTIQSIIGVARVIPSAAD